MAAKIINGDKIAASILEETKKKVGELKVRAISPKLVVILLGENPASEAYVGKKKIAAEALGIEFELLRFPEDFSEKELVSLLNELNFRVGAHAVLVQLPLPGHMDVARVLDAVSPLKDVDGFTAFNLGLLDHGREEIVSCTAYGILKLVESTGVRIEGANVCIINHSIIVGRPLAQMMLNRNATVTVCNAFTKDLASFTKKADVLVVAVGKHGLISADMVKPGAIVIDAGIARLDGKIVGDIDFEAVKETAGFITPVPGGVGPMTVACLMRNVAILASVQRK